MFAHGRSAAGQPVLSFGLHDDGDCNCSSTTVTSGSFLSESVDGRRRGINRCVGIRDLSPTA